MERAPQVGYSNSTFRQNNQPAPNMKGPSYERAALVSLLFWSGR